MYFPAAARRCSTPSAGPIHHIGNVHKYARREDVPERTLFVITTDGLENASRRYDYAAVRRMIERQKERYGWEFLFLGANIDAAREAARFGIRPDRAVNYRCDRAGTALNYEVIGDAVCSVRALRAADGGLEEKDRGGSPGAGISSAYPHMNRRLSDVRRLSPGLPPVTEIFCLTECSASKTCRPRTAHRS